MEGSRNDLPDMQSIEQMALDHSLDLQKNRIDARMADEETFNSYRQFFPSVSVSYRRNRTVARRDFDNGRYSVQLNVSQPVYDGGKTALRAKLAELNRARIRDRKILLRNEIRFEARKIYLSVQRAIAQLEIQRASLKRSAALLERSRVELRNGLITRLDYSEIKNRHQSARLSLKSQKEKLRQAVQDLCILTGIGVSRFQGIRLLDLSELQINTNRLSHEELSASASNQHPEMIKARRTLYQAREEHDIANNYYLPRIALTARYGKTGQRWPPETAEWGFGFSISFRGLNSTLSNNLGYNRSQNGTSRSVNSAGKLDLLNELNNESRILRQRKKLMSARRRVANLRELLPLRVKNLIQELWQRRRELDLQRKTAKTGKKRFQADSIRYENGNLSLEEYREEEMRMIRSTEQLRQKQSSLLLFVARMERELGLSPRQLQILKPHYLSQADSRRFFRNLFSEGLNQ
ncbi:MAG: TolC family protein [Leptospiraceae bacterium]